MQRGRSRSGSTTLSISHPRCEVCQILELDLEDSGGVIAALQWAWKREEDSAVVFV
jgi:hypothetical protein